MYFLNKFCCICLYSKSDLKHLFDVDNDGISHYNKLTSTVAEMNFREMNDQRFICGKCCVTLNTVYTFRQTCLRSKTNLINYISQLQTFSHVSGTISVRLKDVKQIEKPEHEIKVEVVDSCLLKENVELRPCIYNHENKCSHSIKEEYESEEDSSAHEDATVGLVNENSHSDVKIEDGQTITQDINAGSIEVPSNIKRDIDIDDDPLFVKEEPIESPQDGSTSQAIVDVEMNLTNISPKLNESEKNQVEKPFKCDLCDRTYMNRSSLKLHKLKHSDVRRYECEICHKKFIHKNLLKHHQRTYPFDKKFECKKCEITFPYKTCFTDHMRIHSGEAREKPFECEVCKKRFVYKSNLNEHMVVHSDDKPYECEICKKKFSRKSHFNRHMGIHSSVRPFECELCKKSFSYKSYYTEHMQVHNTANPYKCEICERIFLRKSALTRHKELHCEILECVLCSARFTTKKYYSIHMRTHSDNRPFKCELCKNAYTSKRNLNSHMRTHSAERAFTCEVCLKKFVFKSNLKNHMQLHSNEKPFECNQCGKAFFTHNHLQIHIRRNHFKNNIPQEGP